MSVCMKEVGLECQNTEDDKGQQRFTGTSADFMAKYDGKSGFYKAVYEFKGKESGKFKTGIDLISEQSIGFHWLRYPAFLMRYHAVLRPEDACPKESPLVQSYVEYISQDDDNEDIEVDTEEE